MEKEGKKGREIKGERKIERVGDRVGGGEREREIDLIKIKIELMERG